MSARISHEKVLLIILLLLVVLGIAAGVGVWKVRYLADSKLLIKEETIFTLKPGTGRLALGEQLYADKIINRPRVFNGCCVSNRIFLTLKPGLTALHRR